MLWGSSRWGASVQLAPVVAPHTTEMALRRAAALLARLPSTSMQPQLAPAVFTRGMSGGLERFKEGQPVQTKRPAYDERDTPHTDKWLEVRSHGSPATAVHRIQRRIVINVADIVAWTSSRSPIARVDAAEPASPDKPSRMIIIATRPDQSPPPQPAPLPKQAAVPSPMEMINEIEPIPIHADRVSCKSEGACMDRYGERMGLGAPNTYYQLNSTTKDAPVKCKYCGLRFYGVH